MTSTTSVHRYNTYEPLEPTVISSSSAHRRNTHDTLEPAVISSVCTRSQASPVAVCARIIQCVCVHVLQHMTLLWAQWHTLYFTCVGFYFSDYHWHKWVGTWLDTVPWVERDSSQRKRTSFLKSKLEPRFFSSCTGWIWRIFELSNSCTAQLSTACLKHASPPLTSH